MLYYIKEAKRFMHVLFPNLVGPVRHAVDCKEASRRFAEAKIKDLTPRAKNLYQEMIALSMNRSRGLFGHKNLEAEFVTRYFIMAGNECKENLQLFLEDVNNTQALNSSLASVMQCHDMWKALEAYYWMLMYCGKVSESDKEWWRVFTYSKMKDWLDSNIATIQNYGLARYGYIKGVEMIVTNAPTLREVIC
jgi:hypothetical protein